MQYQLSLCDEKRESMVVFTLREIDVKRPAIDIMFDIVGANPVDLAQDGVIPEGQVEDLRTIQAVLFSSDAQGLFINESASVYANGKELNPDASLSQTFQPAERDGTRYMRSELTVVGSSRQVRTGSAGPQPASSDADKLVTYARMMFLHQIAIGFPVDVTKESAYLGESIAEAEKNGWIEIDVEKVCYKLTIAGKQIHDGFINEAQQLLQRYDIYGDVDVSSDGTIRFDTKLGQDLRIAMFELDGVDPYRARYLIGLNDGEWDQLSDWERLYKQASWYEQILGDVNNAPGANDFDRNLLLRILDKGKEQLRMDSRLR